ncbi:hypothetical protein V8Z80_10375 [Orrella sp. JC864]|uniref:hypothetical protein n=1 Tax=Orrella sp. JC864 TaxID=3120298 RepID=UPI0030099325
MPSPAASNWTLQRLAATAGVALVLAALALTAPATAQADGGPFLTASAAAQSASR